MGLNPDPNSTPSRCGVNDIIRSVAYAVEKIPAFKVLSPSGILAAYFAEAKRDGLPLRQQCNDLGIPWAARLIPLAHVSEASVKAAGVMSPSMFSQTLPQGDVETWARRVVHLYEHGASAPVVHWAARHGLSVNADANDYLLTLRELAPSTKPETINKRSATWHREMSMKRLGLVGQAVVPDHLRSVKFVGLQFDALVSPEDFWEESASMHHCVQSRFGKAVTGHCIYFSIKKDGKRVATVEYTGTNVAMTEIKGVSNAKPPEGIKTAAIRFGREVLAEATATTTTKPEADTILNWSRPKPPRQWSVLNPGRLFNWTG